MGGDADDAELADIEDSELVDAELMEVELAEVEDTELMALDDETETEDDVELIKLDELPAPAPLFASTGSTSFSPTVQADANTTKTVSVATRMARQGLSVKFIGRIGLRADIDIK